MPLGGVEAVQSVRDCSPATRVLLYSGQGERRLAREALAAGAQGLLLKSAPLAEVARAVRIVAEGGSYVDHSLAGSLLPEGAPRAEEGPRLTDREHEVLCMLADGNTNEPVAKALGISADTVQTHVRNAMKKLGAETRRQAVATAMCQSLVS